MRILCKIFLLSFLSLHLYGQECSLRINDTITISEVLPYNLQKTYNYRIDANDLLNKQTVDFLCWLVYEDGSRGLIALFSFKYRIYRDNCLLSEGINESYSYLSTKLGELIYDSEAGDSLLFYDYKTHIDYLKNVHLLPLSYKIIKNSIHKSDKNELDGYKLIGAAKILNNLFDLYPGCGGSTTFFRSDTPEYNQEKTKLSYHFQFLTKDFERGEPIIDYDFTFIYSVSSKKMVVYDHLSAKEYNLLEWTKKLEESIRK